MDDNSLQINIEAIDDASSVLEGVAASAAEMADQLATAAGNANESLSSMEGGMTGLTTTWEQSVAELNSAMDTFDATMGTSASAFDTAVAEMESEAATAAAGIEESMAGAGEAANTSGLMTSGGLLAIGIAAKQIGAPLEAFYKSTIGAAEDTQNAIANAQTLTQGIVLQANELVKGDGAVSAAKKDVIDKINQQKVAIAALEAPISGAGKTINQLAEANAKAAAQIALHRDTLATLQGKLEIFNNLQSEAGANATDLTQAIEDQANKNIQLGFTYSDSIDSIAKLSASTGSLKSGLEANADAMALSALKGISLSAASDAISQAFQGNGRALQNYGVIIKDGLSGSQALSAVWAVMGTELKNQQGTIGQSIRVLNADWNKFMNDLGNSQNGILGPLITTLGHVVTALDHFTQAHPEATKAILLFVGALGLALVAFGGVVTFLALIAGSVALLGGAVVAGIALIIAGVVALVVLIVTQWHKILEAAKVVGEAIKYTWKAVVDYLSDIFLSWYNKVMAWIDSIKSAFQNVKDTIASGPSGIIKGAVQEVQYLAGKRANGGPVDIGSAYLVGENGPELFVPGSSGNIIPNGGGSPLAGGTGGITVYINGQIYTTEDQAKKLGDQIAKQINRQLKLATFR